MDPPRKTTRFATLLIAASAIACGVVLVTVLRSVLFASVTGAAVGAIAVGVCLLAFLVRVLRAGSGSVRILVALTIVAASAAALTVEIILGEAGPAGILGLPVDTNVRAIPGASRLRAEGLRVYPFAPDVIRYQYIRTSPGDSAIPLAGIGSVRTFLCNETGTYLLYTADRFGLLNPDFAWNEQRPHAALIGDSFAHGQCVTPAEGIAGRLRRTLNVINAGVSGAGPLAELGVLREYVARQKPRAVVWLFYEGNDMENLAWERGEPGLTSYLNARQTQQLATVQSLLDSEMRHLADSALTSYRDPSLLKRAGNVLLLKRLRGALQLALHPPPASPTPDFALLRNVIATARNEITSWGGTLLFVYLPERRRFAPRITAVRGENHDSEEIRQSTMRIVKALGIPAIDMAAAFAASPSPLDYWAGARTHYTPAGYELVADSVSSRIEAVLRLGERSASPITEGRAQ